MKGKGCCSKKKCDIPDGGRETRADDIRPYTVGDVFWTPK